MSARALEDAGFLEEGDEFSIFAGRAVSPAVDFVGDASDGGGKEPHPVEPSEEGDRCKNEASDDHGCEVAFPEIGLGEVAGLEVVFDVGFDDPFSDEGPVFATVGIFEPVEDTGGEVDSENYADGLGGDGEDVEEKFCIHDGDSVAWNREFRKLTVFYQTLIYSMIWETFSPLVLGRFWR